MYTRQGSRIALRTVAGRTSAIRASADTIPRMRQSPALAQGASKGALLTSGVADSKAGIADTIVSATMALAEIASATGVTVAEVLAMAVPGTVEGTEEATTSGCLVIYSASLWILAASYGALGRLWV